MSATLILDADSIEAIADAVARRINAQAPAPVVDREWLSSRQAAEHLGVSLATLERRRADGSGPKEHRSGRLIRYRRSDLDAYLAKGRK